MVVDIAAVDDDDAARGHLEILRDRHIGHIPLGDQREMWQTAVVVEHQVQFHRALGGAVSPSNMLAHSSITVESIE